MDLNETKKILSYCHSCFKNINISRSVFTYLQNEYIYRLPSCDMPLKLHKFIVTPYGYDQNEIVIIEKISFKEIFESEIDRDIIEIDVNYVESDINDILISGKNRTEIFFNECFNRMSKSQILKIFYSAL